MAHPLPVVAPSGRRSGAPHGARGPDPFHCPLCGTALVEREGVGACPSCGFSWAEPDARRLWGLELDLDRLAHERDELVGELRTVRRVAPPALAVPGHARPSDAGGRPVAAPRRRRQVSVPELLVGLGASLLVIAGIVFAAVTWERLGATGQGAVLVAATLTAAGLAVLAGRRGLRATAEALGAVAAGFALVDIHAARVALGGDTPWELVWAVGLTVVAGLLWWFGRATGLLGPVLVAVAAVQVPLVLVASRAEPRGVAVAASLLAVAAADQLVATRPAAQHRLPSPAGRLLRAAAPVAWAWGVAIAAPGALDREGSGGSVGEQWWSIGLLVLAAGLAGARALAGPARGRLPVAAAAAATVVGLAAVSGTARALGAEGEILDLVMTAVPSVVLVWSLVGTAATRADDLRVRATRWVSGAWAGAAVLGWAVTVAPIVAAPLGVLADRGTWSFPPGVRTDAIGLDGTVTGSAADAVSTGLLLVGLALAALAAAVLVAAVWAERGARRQGGAWAAGVAVTAGWAVVGVRADLPVAALGLVHAAAAVAVLAAAVVPRSPRRPLPSVGAVPLAGLAVAWALLVEEWTVVVAALLTAALVAATALAVGRRQQTRAVVVTGVTAAGLLATSVAAALAAGADAGEVGLTLVAVGVATSAVGPVADRWAAWWSPVADLAAVGLAAVGMAVTAAGGTVDQASWALGVVAVGAAAHVLRPSRRVPAAVIAAGAGVVLSWVRLWEGGVRAVEAYSVPPAVLLLIVGAAQLRRRSSLGSWPALGPGLVVAAAPSAVVALGGEPVTRPLAVLGVAAVVTAAGALLGLRAPLAVGAVTALVMAVDQLFPVAARLPRWAVIATAGALLLVLGTTFERQRRRVTVLARRYRDLR